MELQLPHYTYRATVVKVIDGDTIDVDIDVGFHTTLRKRLRFLGIDTWEVRGEEKEKGLIAKARLQEVLDQAETIYVQTVMDATGKYGRVLAWVWTVMPTNWSESGEHITNVNELLLREGHGTEYPS